MSFIWNPFIVFLRKAERGNAGKLLLNPCRINLYSLFKDNKIRFLTSNSFKSFWMSGSTDINLSIAIHELVIKLNILKNYFSLFRCDFVDFVSKQHEIIFLFYLLVHLWIFILFKRRMSLPYWYIYIYPALISWCGTFSL